MAKIADPSASTGVAIARTDAESGQEGGDDRAQALRALDLMLQRGLISKDVYEERRADILKAG